MSEAWYVLCSKPHKENFLTEQLCVHNFDIFNPCIRAHPVNPRARKMKPYFPGYVFVRLDLNRVCNSLLQWMPGAIGLVSFGGEPAHVSDELIHAIRRQVAMINSTGGETPDEIRPGETVTVQSGPFTGYEAIFDARLSGNERVRVFLNLLSKQQFPLELPAKFVQRKLLSDKQFIQTVF